MDLVKAYDQGIREELWEVLQRYGVSGDLLRAIRAMHQASEACVRVESEMTEWFEVSQAVRQGCPMSPCGLSRYGGPKSTGQFQGGVH